MNSKDDLDVQIRMMNNTLSSLQADSLLADLDDMEDDDDDSDSLFDISILQQERFSAGLPQAFNRPPPVATANQRVDSSAQTSAILTSATGQPAMSSQSSPAINNNSTTALSQLLDLLAQQGELISRQQRSIDHLQQQLDKLNTWNGVTEDRKASGKENKGSVVESINADIKLDKRITELEASLKADLKSKVDQRVLRELMRHIVTKKDMKQQFLAATASSSQTNHREIEHFAKQQIDFDQLNALIDVRLARLQTDISDGTKLHSSPPARPLEESILESLRAEFDDKLMMLQETLLNARNSSHAFGATKLNALAADGDDSALWLWTSGSIRYDLIQWTSMPRNSDSVLYQWSADSSAANIHITKTGVYELAIGLFSGSAATAALNARCTLQVLIDGMAVISAVQSPAFLVRHHGSRVGNASGSADEGGAVISSNNFTDFLQISAGSALSVACINLKQQQQQVPTAFLRIRRII